jgi:hypothetical protein
LRPEDEQWSRTCGRPEPICQKVHGHRSRLA